MSLAYLRTLVPLANKQKCNKKRRLSSSDIMCKTNSAGSVDSTCSRGSTASLNSKCKAGVRRSGSSLSNGSAEPLLVRLADLADYAGEIADDYSTLNQTGTKSEMAKWHLQADTCIDELCKLRSEMHIAAKSSAKRGKATKSAYSMCSLRIGALVEGLQTQVTVSEKSIQDGGTTSTTSTMQDSGTDSRTVSEKSIQDSTTEGSESSDEEWV